MSIKKKMCVYIFICSFLATPIVYAQEANQPLAKDSSAHKDRHAWMEKRAQEIYGQLNLTEAQKKQLEDNKLAHRGNKKDTFEKMKSYRETLNKELMKPELDMNKINEIQSQFKAMQAQMIDDHLSSILEVRKILTPEQFAKFISLMEQHKFEHKSGVHPMESMEKK